MMLETPRELTHSDYTVGWICALPNTELVAAAAMLDEKHRLLPAADSTDTNSYLLGQIGDHNVVVACLPAEITGKVSASSVATNMIRSFPAVRFGLMVGIGGGAPYDGVQEEGSKHDLEDDSEDDSGEVRDIRLGDIVVSLHSKSTEAVVQYDYGKSMEEKEFIHVGGRLNKPPLIVLNAVSMPQQQHKLEGNRILEILDGTISKYPAMVDEFKYPGSEKDRLFKSKVVHVKGKKSCKACCGGPSDANLVRRDNRSGPAPKIHYGTIGSADQVMKNATLRDKWAQEENIICFEMDAAGLMDTFPCLVIRGICDYADSHKNDFWQPYAAATAASYAKELLHVIPGQGIVNLPFIKQFTEQVNSIEQKTAEIMQVVISSQEEQLRAKLASSMSQLDYGAKHTDIVARHKHGTGRWLLTCDTFKNWMETLNQTLFCPGVPGAGKTILASVIIEHLQLTFRTENVGISYVYCVYNEKHTAESLLACMIKQLIRQLPTIPQYIENLYSLHERHSSVPRGDDLIQVFVSVASSFARVFIVIDAIDECLDEKNRSEFLERIKKIKGHANMLVTSRNIPSIEFEFEGDLREDILATNEDIEMYVESELSRESFVLSANLRSDPELRRLIVDEIVQNAEGMFLHADFHVNHLSTKHNIRDLREALDNLPTTSEAIYENAMERIRSQSKEAVTLALSTLQWLLGASESLSIKAIQHALAVRKGDKAIAKTALTTPKHLLSICGGLVAIDEESNVVRLVHHTALEYFQENQVKYFPNAQTDIALTCLRYLLLEEFGQGHSPTLDYYNFRKSEYPLLDLGDEGWFWDFPEKCSGIHYAAYFGLADILEYLLAEQGVKIDSADMDGRTPLSWAAEYGHEAVVRILLENDAAVNKPNTKDGKTPLIYAVENGHAAIIGLLLSNRGAVDSKDSRGWSPLLWAAHYGQDEVAKVLLEKGAAVNSKDRWGRTPLAHAAHDDRREMVKLLLENGAKIDIRDSYGTTPLIVAAKRGHECVVKLLLESGAAVNRKDAYYRRSPLSWAAGSGHEAVVELLLEDGAAVDQKDSHFGRTPLSNAAAEGHKAVVKLLLEENAEVNSTDKRGRSPLSQAAGNGHERVIRTLLEKHAAMNLADTDFGGTPLSWAAKNGKESVVKLLLDNGAEVDAKDTSSDMTPLSWAAREGHDGVANLLLERGAVLILSEADSRTLLLEAVRNGNKSLMKLLLQDMLK